ncbi:MAG: hypothetical protein E7182_01635 [Erysipelotrichaceae bacterium]|nr:hypothetical protein [Erysipelotrichaceae bacterium]
MPKITREKIQKAKYTSMADLYRQLDMIPNFDDKVEFATNCLLSHGADGRATDYSFEEAVHLARLKLVDESKKLRDKIYNDEEGPDPADLYIDFNEQAVNPYAEDEKDDIENQFFLGHPAEYLKSKAEKCVKEISDQDLELNEEISFKENCIRLSRELNTQKSIGILTMEEKGTAPLDIKARMEAKYLGRERFKKMENVTRPSWFTRTFGTRSNAGKNFDEVYAAFNNPKHALYGNLDALEQATSQYLDYKASTRSAAENAVGLRVREPKEGFAEHLLASIREQKANNEVFKPIVGQAARKEMTAESVEAIKGPEPAEENEHRQNLVLDLSDDDDSLIDDSVEEESEMEKGLVNDDEEPSVEA